MVLTICLTCIEGIADEWPSRQGLVTINSLTCTSATEGIADEWPGRQGSAMAAAGTVRAAAGAVLGWAGLGCGVPGLGWCTAVVSGGWLACW